MSDGRQGGGAPAAPPASAALGAPMRIQPSPPLGNTTARNKGRRCEGGRETEESNQSGDAGSLRTQRSEVTGDADSN